MAYDWSYYQVDQMHFVRLDGLGGTANGTFVVGYEMAPSYPYEVEYMEKANYLRGLTGTLSKFLWWGGKRRWMLKFESINVDTVHLLGSHFFSERADESFGFFPTEGGPMPRPWFICKLTEPWRVKLSDYGLWNMTVTFEEV